MRAVAKFTFGVVGCAAAIVVLGPLIMKLMDLVFKLLVK